MNHIKVFLVLMVLSSGLLWPQENNLSSDDEIDSLFDENNDQESADETIDDETTEEESDILNNIVRKNDFSVKADFLFLTSYSPGLNYLPWDPVDSSLIAYQDMAGLMIQSAILLNYRISPEFRVEQKIISNFEPLTSDTFNFTTEINEFFCDYTIADILFFRIGRQNLTWGVSRNYPFTNLPARIPAGSTSVGADSYAVKINFPIGVGGLEGLIFARNCYFDDPESPAIDEIGYGGRFNVAIESFDFNIGAFYNKNLHLRSFCSLTTTLFKKLEVYAEGLFAADLDYSYSPTDNQADFSADAGFYINLSDDLLEINGEYFYNGEESELSVKDAAYTLFYGHNLALNLRSRILQKKISLLFQGKYNVNANSGLLISAINFSLLPNFTLTLAVPVIFGSLDKGYSAENSINGYRRISIVLAAIIKGGI